MKTITIHCPYCMKTERWHTNGGGTEERSAMRHFLTLSRGAGGYLCKSCRRSSESVEVVVEDGGAVAKGDLMMNQGHQVFTITEVRPSNPGVPVIEIDLVRGQHRFSSYLDERGFLGSIHPLRPHRGEDEVEWARRIA